MYEVLAGYMNIGVWSHDIIPDDLFFFSMIRLNLKD